MDIQINSFKNLDTQSLVDDAIAVQMAALGHPVRIKIMQHLACNQGRCCKDVVGALPLAQSTVSQHLKVLVDAGLVTLTAEGKRSRYSVDTEAMQVLGGLMSQLVDCCTSHATSCK